MNGIRARWHELQEFVPENDIMVITETKIDAQTTGHSISIAGYLLNRHDRTNHGEGVATFITDNLVSDTLMSHQEDASKAGLEVTINRIKRPAVGRDLIVIGVYRPPSAKAEFCEDFSELLQVLPLRQLCILGDINADLMKPRIQPGKALREALSLPGTKVHSTVPTSHHRDRHQH